MLILLLFAFLAGFVTVLSPCILPILPIVLSSSITGGKKRPLGIVTGFIASFTFFTLMLATLVKATGISPEVLRTISIIVIAGFGLSLCIPKMQLVFEQLFSSLTRFAPRSTQDPGFFGGILIGLSLGLLWTPCVGPILASVITLAITSSVSFFAVLITLVYSIGTAIPMLIITLTGRSLLQKIPWLLSSTGKIQKAFGLIMIGVAISMYFNLDRTFQTFILETFPGYGAGLTSFEDNAVVRQQLEGLNTNGSQQKISSPGLSSYGKAPDFIGASSWLNSKPYAVDRLKGKVVLVDFWTYSCINCIRTLPYLRSWHEKYESKGLVIIGVHSPEFEFEKDKDNVLEAMKDFGITYPVVQDNEFFIWRAYQNRYWPAKYLIDKEGVIRYQHFGEGKYVETENAIRSLLDEEPLDKIDEEKLSFSFTKVTPEIYLGRERAQHYTQTLTPIRNDTMQIFRFNDPLGNDEVGLAGRWKIENERITSGEDHAKLYLNFNASNVYLVLGGSNSDNIPVTVKLDGAKIDSSALTKDFNLSGGISVTRDRKYDIVDLKGDVGRHVLEITIPQGISAYAFTF